MSIIIGGKELETPGVLSRTWLDHGMTFDLAHAPLREEAIRWCVLHWTAAERTGEEGAATIHRSLSSDGLSVEFAITNEGTIWQFVDPLERRCRHCSRVNPFSVGIEVSGVGWARPERPPRGDTVRREVYRAEVHGWMTSWYDYLEAQHRAAAGLASALLEAIPSLHGRVELEPFARRSQRHFQRFSGFCGHLHAASMSKKNPKCDPATRPLERLAEHLAPR